ncbi:MAG TPA: hypothetical protein V6C57_04130, partial [Coleofasciculaceae cyanobacterium]
SPQPVPPQPASPLGPSSSPVRMSGRHGQTLKKDSDWVESTWTVGKEGRRLILTVQGNVELQSAEVQLADGSAQPIQVHSQPYENGEFLLLDLDGLQQVQSIHLVGRTNLRKSAYSVELWN